MRDHGDSLRHTQLIFVLCMDVDIVYNSPLMSIYVDSGETIFRMINWMALLLHPDFDGTMHTTWNNNDITFLDNDGIEMHFNTSKLWILFDEEDHVYVDWKDARMTIYVDNGVTVYAIRRDNIPTRGITMDEFVDAIPSELNELCEYIMSCGIIEIRGDDE